MKLKRWSVSCVAEATGNTYDSVCSFLTNRGLKAKNGMTFDMVLDYLQTRKNKKRETATEGVEELKALIEQMYEE